MLLKLLRVKHWMKNLLLFFPIFFAGKIFQYPDNRYVIFGFLSFSLISSAGYIFNDVLDRNKDRLHEKKRLRPIASGRVKIPLAMMILCILLISGLCIGGLISFTFSVVVFIYFTNVVLYSLFLKKVLYLDIFIIAFGFMLRLVAGGVAADVQLSAWLIVLTGAVALMLGAGKRFEEIQVHQNESIRKVASLYRSSTLKVFIWGMGSISVIIFGVYLFGKGQFDIVLLMVSGVLVFNYIVNVIRHGKGDPTDFFFRNKINILFLGVWTLLFLKKIYL